MLDCLVSGNDLSRAVSSLDGMGFSPWEITSAVQAIRPMNGHAHSIKDPLTQRPRRTPFPCGFTQTFSAAGAPRVNDPAGVSMASVWS